MIRVGGALLRSSSCRKCRGQGFTRVGEGRAEKALLIAFRGGSAVIR